MDVNLKKIIEQNLEFISTSFIWPFWKTCVCCTLKDHKNWISLLVAIFFATLTSTEIELVVPIHFFNYILLLFSRVFIHKMFFIVFIEFIFPFLFILIFGNDSWISIGHIYIMYFCLCMRWNLRTCKATLKLNVSLDEFEEFFHAFCIFIRWLRFFNPSREEKNVCALNRILQPK